jgi:hypothetical protein
LHATNPGEAILIREKEPTQAPSVRRYKTYGFADGHSEFHREGAEGFDAWERKRMPKLRQPQPDTQPEK